MRYLLILLVFCAMHFPVFGQAKGDTIEIVKTRFFIFYKMDGKNLTYRKLTSSMRTDPEAQRLYHRSRPRGLLGAFTEGCGIGLLVAEYTNAQVGIKVQPVVVVAGACLFALSIPINISSDRMFKRAILMYNEDVQKTSFNSIKPEYYFTLSGNGVGLIMRF